jgi:hypothetical protein
MALLTCSVHSAAHWKQSSTSRGAMSDAASAGSVFGQVVRHQRHTLPAADARPLDHLVGRAVEEALVDLSRR